jgi:hypothetical protein
MYRYTFRITRFHSMEWFELVALGYVTATIEQVNGESMARMIKEERN